MIITAYGAFLAGTVSENYVCTPENAPESMWKSTNPKLPGDILPDLPRCCVFMHMDCFTVSPHYSYEALFCPCWTRWRPG